MAAAPKLKTSWRNIDPAATPVSNVLVINFTRDVASRRSMEDSLAAEIAKNGGKAQPSYTIVPGDLVSLRLGPVLPADRDGRARGDGVHAVSGVMIWTGLSESTNPGSVRNVSRDVAVAVGADLKKRNVLRR